PCGISWVLRKGPRERIGIEVKVGIPIRHIGKIEPEIHTEVVRGEVPLPRPCGLAALKFLQVGGAGKSHLYHALARIRSRAGAGLHVKNEAIDGRHVMNYLVATPAAIGLFFIE